MKIVYGAPKDIPTSPCVWGYELTNALKRVSLCVCVWRVRKHFGVFVGHHKTQEARKWALVANVNESPKWGGVEGTWECSAAMPYGKKCCWRNSANGHQSPKLKQKKKNKLLPTVWGATYVEKGGKDFNAGCRHIWVDRYEPIVFFYSCVPLQLVVNAKLKPKQANYDSHTLDKRRII